MRFIKKKAGFVLVELILVTVILGAVFPLSLYFIDSMKAAREAKLQQTANYLAQKQMEEYKAKDLAEILAIDTPIETIINGRPFYTTVAVEPFLVSEDAVNSLGNVQITAKSLTDISIKMGASEFLVLAGDQCTLKLSGSLLELFKDEVREGYVSITLPAGDPELNLYIRDNPLLTLDLRNETNKLLIVNKLEEPDANPLFELNAVQGKIQIRNSEVVAAYENGTNIIVTVKDKNNEVLAETAQTRFINWSFSQS